MNSNSISEFSTYESDLQKNLTMVEIGRFISPDIISILNETMFEANGLNLYGYCGNNPIMRIDPSGNAWWNPFSWNWEAVLKWTLVAVVAVAAVTAIVVGTAMTGGLGLVLTGAGAGALIGGAFGGISAHINGTDLASGILGGAITGAALGAAAPLSAFGTVGFGIMLGTTFVAGMLSYTVETLGNHQKFNVEEMFKEGAITSLQGIITFGVGSLLRAGGFFMKGAGLMENLIQSYLSKAIGGHLSYIIELIADAFAGKKPTKKEFILDIFGIWLS